MIKEFSENLTSQEISALANSQLRIAQLNGQREIVGNLSLCPFHNSGKCALMQNCDAFQYDKSDCREDYCPLPRILKCHKCPNCQRLEADGERHKVHCARSKEVLWIDGNWDAVVHACPLIDLQTPEDHGACWDHTGEMNELYKEGGAK